MASSILRIPKQVNAQTNTTATTTEIPKTNATGTKHDFTMNTSGDDVVNAYQAKVPFKQFIMKNIGQLGVRQVIAEVINGTSLYCPNLKDSFGRVQICDEYISLAKLSCDTDSKVSYFCKNPVINQYVQQRQLTTKAMNLFAYQQLADCR